MTKKQEILLKKALDKVYAIGFGLEPPDELDKYFAKKLMILGTTVDEKFNSLKGVRTLIKRQKEQTKGLKVRFKRKEVYRGYQAGENVAVVVEEIAVTIKIKKETIRFDVRSSAVMEFENGQWKLVHWHASKPEMVASEADTYGIDAWKEKAEVLAKQVEERTADLVVKNRELAIEASLERVRTVAMGLKEPANMLEVCKTISFQLESLGVKEIRNVQTAIFYPVRDTYMNYEYYTRHRKTFITETYYTDHKVAKAFAAKMQKGKGQVYITSLKGDKVKEWISYQKKTNVFIDKYLEKASSLSYYWHSLGPVALGISTYTPLSKDELKLFNRFINVFELAYTRYLDIEKALAQAKEARVEAALEKVRAEAMAMHRPDDVLNVCKAIFHELPLLGFKELRNALINFWDDARGSLIDYDYSDFAGGHVAKLAYNSHPVFNQFQKKIRGSKDAFAQLVITKKQLASWKKRRIDSGEYEDPRLDKIKALYYYFYSIGVGSVGISSFKPLTAENIELLKRFRNVFDLAYRRYLDIQKAEAQAREAQIELALERVRARTMAMQKSEELPEAANLLFQQVQALGMPAWAAGYCNWEEDKRAITLWMSSEGVLQPPFKAPTTEDELFIQMRKGYENGKSLHIVEMGGEELVAHYQYMRTLPVVGEIFDSVQEAGHPLPVFQVMHYAYFSKGFLLIITYESVPDAHPIFKRFAQVFDQTYTRFLDLQKAEAQTREAQINLAVERVRARALAMFRSEEILQVVHKLKEEIMGLDIPNVIAATIHLKEKDGRCRVWDISSIEINDEALHHPMDLSFRLEETHPNFFIRRIWGNTADYFVEMQDENDLKHTVQFLRDNERHQQAEETAQFIAATKMKKLFHPTVKLSNGRMSIDLLEPPASEIASILERMGAAFDLAYKRFEDLQKAEAQAKEAQVEASLERVRSASMAMHSSDELQNVIRVLTDQLTILGFEFHSANFITNASMPDWEIWISSPGSNIPPKLFVPYFNHRLFNERNDAVASGTEILTVALTSEEKSDFLNYFFKHSIAKNTDKERIKWVLDQPGMALTTIVTKSFSLSVINYHGKLYTQSENEVIKRLAHVFEQSYTRFLDLKKAEAQAKEAQIEAALERVRSRTMGMQKSEELREVIQVVYEQFVHLNINTGHTGFVMDYKTRDDYNIWIADPHGAPSQVTIPYFDSIYYNRFNEAKKNGLDFFATILTFEEKNKFYQTLFKYVPGLPEEAKDFYFNCPGLAASTVLLENIGLYIENFSGIPYTDEENATLMRFGKVFQQTYTRFLDLEKAEAQGREAKIEMALERVRSRSLAMHSSGELGEVITVVLNNLLELGYIIDQGAAAHLAIFSEGTKDFFQWSADPTLPHAIRSFIPYTDLPILNEFWDARQKGHDFFARVYSFDEKNTWFNYAFEHSDLKHIPGELKKLLLESETYAHSVAVEKNSAIIINSITGNQLSENQIDILKRFSKVFEQAYVRFLDLQKAEAQSREAQIELGLERVRARAMAMQRSDELKELIGTVSTELAKLDLVLDRCFIMIYDLPTMGMTWWMSNPEMPLEPLGLFVKYHNYPPYMAYVKGWEEQQLKWEYILEGIDKEDWDSFLFTETELSLLPAVVINNMKGLERVHLFASFNKFGCLSIASHQALTIDQTDILLRFAKVFELTYTRFNDLQKAESQAREAQIELGLERVRARAMAMQKSDELNELVGTVYTELTKLDFALVRCLIWVMDAANNSSRLWMANSETPSQPANFYIPYHENPPYLAFLNAWKEKNPKWQYDLHGNIKKDWDEYVFNQTEMQHLPAPVKKGMQASERVLLSASFHNFGCLQTASTEPLKDEQFDILNRFAKVFDLTYTRFNDLQKAEAQAREAQVEASLERIRAKAMAMHHSGELDEVLETLFDQFDILGIHPVSTHMTLIDVATNTFTFRETGKGGRRSFGEQTVAIDSMDIWKEAADRWKTSDPLSLNILHFPKESLPVVWQVFHESFASMPDHAKIVPEDYPDGIYHTAGNCKFGYIGMNQTRKATPEEEQVVLKFAIEFGRLYQRFLDLQKAEIQIREARIEAALEKVRSSSLAMHKSEDLKNVVKLVFDNFNALGLNNIDSVNINIFHEGSKDFDLWLAAAGQNYTRNFCLPYIDHPIAREFFTAKENGEEFHQKVYAHDVKNAYFEYMFEHSDNRYLPEERKKAVLAGPAYAVATGIGRHTSIFIHNYSGLPFSDEVSGILVRFTKVFDQSYRRFLDLQQAEAQAREARIEAALEKVRSRSLAMHKADELGEVITVVVDKLKELDFSVGDGVALITYTEGSKDLHEWMANPGFPSAIKFHLPYFEHPVLANLWKAKNEGAEFIAERYTAKENKSFLKHIFEQSDFRHTPQAVKDYCLAANTYATSIAFQKNTSIFINDYSGKSLSEQEIDILKRFSKVFEQAYIRFLDLQKAEAQAREAQVEAALERVRGKAMSMHSSKDLSDTVDIFFKELKVLGITPLRCGVGELDEAERTSTLSATTAQQQGDSYEVIGKLKLAGHPVLDNIFEHWKLQKEYFPVLKGSELTRYYQVMKPQLSFPDYAETVAHYGNYFYFKEGLVFAWTEKALSEEELQIFRKFTSVVSLTYRRYIELQKSEANAREAVKQAALDRVRAEIASMRTTADLERITPVIWKELTILGIPFIRCGVFIMDEEQQQIHTFLSTPDGKAIGAFHLPYTTTGNIQFVISNWREKRKYIDHWDKESFIDFADLLMKQGTIASPGQYLQGIPQGGFHLHFLPFLQGMLYVGNTIQLDKDEIRLIQSVADAFSTAYARYEDFNKLEAAKEQVDKTLVDLKLTQQQLVQSEKMASLGELTAGIAHEIQNPLNFVNNFSEVSNELIDEMMEEVAKGNYDEVKAIAEDVKQNLEKINHHGKRADGIVKGMLQHSRSSSATKEPTDISKLADEYLRLAYHGLRAKDKTFNATLKTDYDESIGPINIFPQDIGRVILNLITNAFYVVAEKKKKVGKEYEPIVSVTTRRAGASVELSVKDNGSGIPAHVLDKIFQPFFTTKPTGQGTGLGLSLSYDIVKAHGGELKVETKGGEGSKFIIQLPVV